MSAILARRDTIQHKVGTCPSCGVGLIADLLTETSVATPYVASSTGLPVAGVNVERVGASITHFCGQAQDDTDEEQS